MSSNTERSDRETGSMLPVSQAGTAQEADDQVTRHGNLRLAWLIGAVVLFWYVLAMLVVLRP